MIRDKASSCKIW